ncbi:MAG: cysteine peptidase family C39 domain-containing protein, partial [Chitinophagales bacterium]|nr:cysteine peptidase family C39 domain-containing protein [Chitinophagales bacterium]
MFSKFPEYKQLDEMDCGATCLRMISKWYGRDFTGTYLREISYTDRQGINIAGLTKAADTIGLKTMAVRVDAEKLINNAPLPCILHWNQNHFVVLYEITNKKKYNDKKEIYKIVDPAHGKISFSRNELLKKWSSSIKEDGVAILFEPTPYFFKNDLGASENDTKNNPNVFEFIYPYFK